MHTDGAEHALTVADAGQRAAGFDLLLSHVDRVIGTVVESVAGVLVAVEIVVLLAGVISRYLLHRPLSWSDELASMLFLWLAMLGTVVAYRRVEHMRMAALVNGAGPRMRAFADAFALMAGLTFLVMIVNPALAFAIEQVPITTPALAISDAWRASGLFAGVSLMILFAGLQLLRSVRLRDAVLALGVIVAVGLTLFAATPLLMGLGNYKLIVFFVLLVGAAVLSGVPIAFSFGLGTFAFLTLTTRVPVSVIVGRMDEGMSHMILLAVPLFVFLGLIIEISGMARRMVDFLASLIGHRRGGLQYVLVSAMYLVSGISGAKAADMAAIAPVLFPEMKKRGAKPGELVALLAATGAQTETIPPSLVLITIGSVTGVSIAALFDGGMLPAVVLGLMLCAVVWWRSRRDDTSAIKAATWAEAGRAFLMALSALILPVVIRASVVEGIATATEVSTIGIAYTLAYAVIVQLLFAQRVAWAQLWPALIMTASLSGAILFIIGTATGMAWALTQSGFSAKLAAAMTQLPGGAVTFLAASIAVFVVLGSVLEGIPAIVLFGPLMFPIAKLLGINEVHYAMVIILAMGLGLFAPPFGVGYYAACAIGRVDPAAGMRAILPYLLALGVGIVIVAAFPWLSAGRLW